MNPKHLRYFWATVHAGSVTGAASQLRLTPQAGSAQIKLLEDDLGTPLIQPAGRGLALTGHSRKLGESAAAFFAAPAVAGAGAPFRRA